jgi:hypothetical protein
MKAVTHYVATAASALALMLYCSSSMAQQVTGVPRSPGATTTINGKQLPPPDPKFGGIGISYGQKRGRDSKLVNLGIWMMSS